MAKAWWRDSDYELFARLTKERDEARAEVERLRAGKHTRDCRKQSAYNVACVCGADEANRAEVERLREESATQADISSSTIARMKQQLREARADANMLEDRLSESRSEVDRLTDERDELLVRVANQDAELRATREAYIGAKWTNAYRRGAEAMRETCANAMHPIMRSMISRTEAAQTIRALPIPGEP